MRGGSRRERMLAVEGQTFIVVALKNVYRLYSRFRRNDIVFVGDKTVHGDGELF